MSNQIFNLDRFLTHYKMFHIHTTWTKEKKKEYSVLLNYLKKCKKVEINSNRDSKTTKVHKTNGFTIFRVPSGQLGKMKEFRDKWVFMYCYNRYMFNYTLWLFALDDVISIETSNNLKDTFQNYYTNNVI
jgi:hypothetical protein